MVVPAERERVNSIPSIPRFEYRKNEQYFKKYINRHSIIKRSSGSKHDDRNSSHSYTTNKAMPSLSDPKKFRWKNNLCKAMFNGEASAAK